MGALLATTQPARTIIVERGGGPAWWVPLGIALTVA